MTTVKCMDMTPKLAVVPVEEPIFTSTKGAYQEQHQFLLICFFITDEIIHKEIIHKEIIQ